MSFATSLVAVLRSMRRSAKFSALVVFVFAFAMGGAIAGFSAVKALLLEPLPYRDAAALVRVGHTHAQRGVVFEQYSPPDVDDLVRGTTAFESVSPFFKDEENVLVGEQPYQFSVVYVSPNFYDTLGSAAAYGRTPAPGGADTIAISHRAWQTYFAGDPAIVGREIRMPKGPLRVVGVMPAGFEYPTASIDAWFPIGLIGEDDIPRSREVRWMDVVARLKAGVSIDAARAQSDAVVAALAREHGASNEGFDRVAIAPVPQQLVVNERAPVLSLFVATLLVLALASVNVANLMIARAARRERELAVRAALGASRRALAMQVFGESLALALLGAMVGLGLAKLAIEAFAHAAAGRVARLAQIELDPSIVAAAFGVALLTGLAVGAWPALRSARADAARALGRASAGAQSRGETRLRAALVVAQVALVGGLGYAAILLGTSLATLARVDLGFEPDRVATFSVRLSDRKYEENAPKQRGRLALLEAVRAVPGVRDAASSKVATIGGEPERFGLALPSDAKTMLPLEWGLPFVSGRYFETLGVPVLRGRTFADVESRESRIIPIVVNQAFAERWFAGREAVGQELLLMGEHRSQIVGVVGNVSHAGPRMPQAAAAYLPSSMLERSLVTVVARVEHESPAMLQALRDAVRAVDPGLPVTDLKYLDEQVALLDERAHWLARALGAFAAFGCLLGGIGIFSVLSYVVALRSREMALKLAIGARPGELAGAVLSQAMKLALAGGLLAIPLGIGAARVIEALLHGVEPTTPTMLAAMLLAVLLLAAAAAALPARRAARTEPMVALRAE
ncbi:MAG TPA: ADOP family duplicated permease [Xanthomonadales bacterium]|nr:ADOP family duplicated permease [Xanthomonadales bacterium]